jgi:hypothetical protein
MISVPVTSLRRFDTHRLLPAKYSPHDDSVLTRLSGEDDEALQQIFELDHVTNARLLAESGGSLDIGVEELVFRIPNYRVINAAFTHPNPLGARFSSPHRGAWYAAFELATAKAEVLFHKTLEFAEIDWQEREEMDYDDYLADFTQDFHDLRQGHHEDVLNPNSYVRSQELAGQLLEADAIGVIYPSVRREGGTCLACFRPSVVANVRKSAQYQLIWTPQRGRFVRQEKRVSSPTT